MSCKEKSKKSLKRKHHCDTFSLANSDPKLASSQKLFGCVLTNFMKFDMALTAFTHSKFDLGGKAQ